MLTKEEYEFVNGYRGILDIFEKTGEYIGGTDNLIAWHEKKYEVKIDSWCQGCMVGFLNFTISMIKQYEKTNGSTKG